MIKSAKDIKKAYRDIYKNLESHYAILMSPEFSLPSKDELIDAVVRHSVKDIIYRDNISDCEKLAWYLIWGIHKERSLDMSNDGRTWALGWLTGIQIDLMGETPHTLPTAYTADEEVVIINPKNDAILEPDVQSFNAFLKVM